MITIGVDYHPSFQTAAFLIEETAEYGEQELNHSNGEADRFYRDLRQRRIHVRVGMEATGHALWFERLLAELGFELRIGDPVAIKTKRVRKQKTDRTSRGRRCRWCKEARTRPLEGVNGEVCTKKGICGKKEQRTKGLDATNIVRDGR